MDPIVRFLPPIDPWVQSGLGWGDVATGVDGEPVCRTNRPPGTSCDPDGSRPFLHAGFDAQPAPDMTVRASAAGRVVTALRSTVSLVSAGRGEGGGVVLIEHDLDGDPATRDDLLQTIYEFVTPVVSVGDIVSQGQVIARTDRLQERHLHFGVRRAPFDPADVDIYRNILPPPGTTGCVPCFGRPLPVPAFPERWEDPAKLFRGPSYWAELLEGGNEGGGAVVETPDGFLVGGWTRPDLFHYRDMWLVKLDADGNIRSQESYDGSRDEDIRRLLPARDGGYIALARSGPLESSGPSPLLVKFDATAGHIEWQTRYVATGFDWGNDLQATSDGGYVIAGTSDTCGCGRRVATITKLDSEGNIQWAKSYRSLSFGSPSTEAISIAETSNGDYVVAGTVSPGDLLTLAVLVFRVDPNGTLIWSSEIRANGRNTPGQVAATSDGGLAVVGSSSLFGGSEMRIWFLKLRGDGSLEYDNFYGPSIVERGTTRLLAMPDGGYVLAGRTFDQGFQHPDPWVLRLDANGQITQQRAFEARSRFDGVTDLISTRGGGFIVTGGQDLSCSQCGFLDLPANFLVVKMNPDLEVTHGCGKETQAFPSPRVSFVAQEPLVGETLPVLASPINLTKSQTVARAYACHEGAYGPPPVFQSASVQSAESPVACDFTNVIESTMCTFGIPGVEATLPVILSGTHDEMRIDAHVTDEDSTPDRSDIVQVQASIAQPGESFLVPVPLLDDGSSQIVLEGQRAPFGEDCFNDPIQGVCSCSVANYPTSSGDLLIGDSVYTHRDALLNIGGSPLLTDCVLSSRHLRTLPFPRSTSLTVSLQATDRIGNTSVWPVPFQVSTGIYSLACSGDACGCCLLLAFDQDTTIQSCSGLEGMPSPQFPCGTCVGIFTGSCPP